MAHSSGRAFLIKKNGTKIASVRQKSFNWTGQPIDVTNDDDAGAMDYLADVFASTELTIQVEGLTDADELFDLALSVDDADKFLTDITVERADGTVLSGNWVLTAYSESGTYQEANTFSGTLIRRGIHTLTSA